MFFIDKKMFPVLQKCDKFVIRDHSDLKSFCGHQWKIHSETQKKFEVNFCFV